MNIDFCNIYDGSAFLSDAYESTNLTDLEKKIADLQYILDNTFKSLDERISAEEKLNNYYYTSIDNLLLLITFVQKTIVELQEKLFIVNACVEGLEKTPWYRKITLNQKQKILNNLQNTAKDVYSLQKQKRMDELDAVITNIKGRKK